MTFRTLIVDDEPLARKSLRLLLSAQDDVVIVGEASHGKEALSLLRREKPDLLFLDVQMPGMSGLQVLQRLGAFESMAVVFVTAYDSYAIEAFERRALDYLLKPYTDERFEQVLSRAKRHIKDRVLTELGSRVLDMLGEEPAGHRAARGFRSGDRAKRGSLLIKDGKRTIVLPVQDIDWIEATDYYARVHAAGKSYLIRESLTSLAATLDADLFARAHRSAIVNVAAISEIQSHSSGDATALLTNGERVRVSRTCRSSLLSRVSLQRSSLR